MKGIKQIKNYRLIREVGKGATGVVYEAVDEKINKTCAIKSIPSSKLQDKRVMENFKRELKLLHELNHNNIVKILGVEKTVNNIYVILEYCNGGNLYDYSYFYRKKFGQPLPEYVVQKILRQLIEGLEYMHDCRTVHRDIKLENILINFNSISNTVNPGGKPLKVEYNKVELNNFSIKLADLGYARELEGAGMASTICGTPITMAPDIINLFEKSSVKDHTYNNKVDLWSLGAITYELLTGQPPFYANNFKQLFEEIMKGKYNLPKNIKISIEAITFINGLLQFFPEKRMSWYEIKLHSFIINDYTTFHQIDLQTIDDQFKNPKQVEIDTRDCNNFLWILFKPKVNNIELDKVDASIYHNPIIEKLQNPSMNGINKYTNHEIQVNKKEIKEEKNVNNNFIEKKEFVEDEESDNEINIGDDEDTIQKKETKETKNETHNKDENKVAKQIKIFDRIFNEMKQDLKNNKNINIADKKMIEEERKIIVKKDSINLLENKKNILVYQSTFEKKDKKREDKIVDHKTENVTDQQIKKTVINTIINVDNKIIDEIPNKIEKEEILENNLATISRQTNSEKNIAPTKDTKNALNNNYSRDKFTNTSNNIISSKVLEISNGANSPFNPNNENTNHVIDGNGNYTKKSNSENNNETNSTDDFIQLKREAELSLENDLNTKNDYDESVWEIISTTSIIENDYQYDADYHGYELIQEYFK